MTEKGEEKGKRESRKGGTGRRLVLGARLGNIATPGKDLGEKKKRE